MKRIIIYVTLLLTCCSPVTDHVPEGEQPKSERMETREKTTELNYYENPRYKDKPTFFVAEDGAYIYHDETMVDEHTLPNDFRVIQKKYYRNGNIEWKTVSELNSVVFQEKFDEKGYLTSRENFDSEFKDIKADGLDFVSFLEKEGWFDRTTGQTAFREEPFPLNTGEFTYEVIRHFQPYSYMDGNNKIIVGIFGIRYVSESFLKSHGKSRSDGTLYLEDKSTKSEPQEGADLNVSYTFDIKKGTYMVDWEFSLLYE